MLCLCLVVLGITIIAACVQSNVSPCALENLEGVDECSRIYLNCSIYEEHSEDYLNFLVHRHELDHMCWENMKFRLCLDSAYEKCGSLETVSSFTETITRNMQFLEDICKPGGVWAAIYLQISPCINNHLRKIKRRCTFTDFSDGVLSAKQLHSAERYCKGIDFQLDCEMNKIERRCGIQAALMYKRIIAMNGLLDACCHPFSPESGSIVDDSAREVFMERLERHGNLVASYVIQPLWDAKVDFSFFETYPSALSSIFTMPASRKESLNPVSQTATSQSVVLEHEDQFSDSDEETFTTVTTNF